MPDSTSVIRLCGRAIDRALAPVMKWHGARPGQFQKYHNTLGAAVNGRYQRYARHCRSHSSSELDDSGVRSQGSVLVRSMMPEPTARALSQQITHLIAQSNSGHDGPAAQLMRKVENPISALGRGVVDIFYSDILDQQIRGFFGSHYRIQWLDCYRSLPTTSVSHSWLWHSDNVPSETLKVMLHLTDAGREQGATQFMSVEDTLAYYRAGYRGHRANRLEDLEGFARQHDLPYRPFHHDAKAGDVMLFLNNTLHKAVPPRAGYRDVLTYLLLPNPIPWDQQLEHDGLAAVESQPGGYPREPWQRRAA